MNKTIFLILGLFVFFIKVNYSQEKCVCCTYNSIDNYDLFEEFFNPDKIVENGITNSTVFTTEKFGDTINNYLQAKFTFNEKGYVTDRKWYNRGGKAHSIYEYKRNQLNQITKITFTYLDSNEVKSDFMKPEVKDYYYDSNNKLIKIKERDYNGKIQEDSISHYTKYEYKNGKKSRILRHYYWDGSVNAEHNYYDRNISYKSKFESYSEMLLDNELWLKIKENYNENGKVIFEETYNVKAESEADTEEYEY